MRASECRHHLQHERKRRKYPSTPRVRAQCSVHVNMFLGTVQSLKPSQELTYCITYWLAVGGRVPVSRYIRAKNKMNRACQSDANFLGPFFSLSPW